MMASVRSVERWSVQRERRLVMRFVGPTLSRFYALPGSRLPRSGAELARSDPDFLFEDDVEVFRMIQADFLGDERYRKSCLGQQLFGAIKANAQDFFFRRSAKDVAEAPLEDTARERHGLDQ